MNMYNWSVNLKRLEKDSVAYERFKLEQMVNWGLRGEKLSRKKLKKHWKHLKLDLAKRRYLEDLLWPKS